MEHLETDVCVVGAGYAGLTAALRLTQAGRSVTVLEARDRVGGRTLTEELPGGGWIDHGGAWLAPGHDAAHGLAREFGVGTYKTYAAGRSVFVRDGVAKPYKGDIPLNAGVVTLLNLAVAMKRLDRMAGTLPLDAPWDAPRAAEWDAVTLGQWIDRATTPGTGRRMLRTVLKDLYVADPGAVSLLGALNLIAAHGDLNALLTLEGGAQDSRVVGGTGGLANRVAAALGDAVRLNAPVHAITQDARGGEVRGEDVTVTARAVVVAVPLPLTGAIRFAPALDIDRANLIQRMPIGAVTKIAMVYDDAWWRADGLNAVSLDIDSPLSVTLDGSPEHAPPGVIACIVAGPQAVAFGKLSAGERREVATRTLVNRFGPKAGAPAAYHEHEWGKDAFARGGYVAHFAPGALTNFGHALRAPCGAIHWAGSETATRHHGSINGAIRSGERAAGEILADVDVRAAASA